MSGTGKGSYQRKVNRTLKAIGELLTQNNQHLAQEFADKVAGMMDDRLAIIMKKGA